MTINKKLRTGIPEADNYIEELENYITNFEASNIKKLILACDEVAGTIADDIIKLKDNLDDEEIDNKLVMMGSKKNKIYQKYREVVGDLKNFKTLSDMVNDLKPKVSTKESKSIVEPETPLVEQKKPKKNIQDFVFDKEA